MKYIYLLLLFHLYKHIQVSGMLDEEGHSINDSGFWKIRHHYFKKEDGKKGAFNAYALVIGDTRGFSPYKVCEVSSHLNIFIFTFCILAAVN